ncbi:MAG: hypothetical protein HYY30_13295 [Chloroflexi bacterium]|nr:hypothetical protein [Chloroflexota bacterium]
MNNNVGFAGRILYVDLTTGQIRKEPLDVRTASQVIGGWGMNALLAYDLIKPGVHAYAPENPIIVGAGVLVGTLSPCCDKVFATYKCPATHVVGTAVGGNKLGATLKWAGYDHVVVTGESPTPVYLKVVDDDVEICDASAIWGKNIDEATDVLSRERGAGAAVACIGPAGERLVNTAMVLINKCSTFGRTMGGVLGSKKLKAIVVEGTRGLQVADGRRFMKTVDALTESHRQDPLREQWIKLGLYFILPVWAKAGHFIANDGAEVYPENEAVERFGPAVYEKLKRRSEACAACMAGDKVVLDLREGKFAGATASFSCPLVAVLAFGVKCRLETLDQAFACLDLANRYGLDALGLANMVDWAVGLYEKGIISIADTGGLPLRRDYETSVILIEQAARNERFGAILAAGWLAAIRRFGPDAERYATHVKGGDPDFDPRVTFGVETLGQATNPRGAHDMPAGGIMIALGRQPEFFAKMARRMGFPENENLSLEPPGANLGRYLAHYENWCTVLNGLGICFRMQSSRLYDAAACAELYTAATGIDVTPTQLVEAAERAYNVYRAVNALHGFGRKDDRFPEKWLKGALRLGERELRLTDYFKTAPVHPNDFERMLDDYYDEKGWDVATGVPTREKLIELGLEKIAADFP